MIIEEGWKIVPLDPTKEMLDVFNDTLKWLNSPEGEEYRNAAIDMGVFGEPLYKAMLSVAPNYSKRLTLKVDTKPQ